MSDLYAVVDKKKKKSHNSSKQQSEVSDLYAVVNKKGKENITTAVKYHCDDINYDTIDQTHTNNDSAERIEMTSITEEYSVVDQFNHGKAEYSDKQGITSQIDKNNCRQDISFPKYHHALWAIAATIMLILIVGLITTTAIGFTIRVTTQDSNITSSSRTENDIFETTSTEDMSYTTQNIDIILARNNDSHLLTFLSSKNLSGLLIDCVARRQFSINECVSLVLSLYGKTILLPALSCRELYTIVPNVISGYYWVTLSNGSSIQVYCEMTKSCGNITGGLTRIATINSYTRSQYCTGEIKVDNIGCVRKSSSPGCSGITFNSKNLSYSHMCGVLEGAYFGTGDGFMVRSNNPSLTDTYVDGISITDGTVTNHIWTFSAKMNGHCCSNAPTYVEGHCSCLNTTFYPPSSRVITFQRDFQNIIKHNISVRLCQDEHRGGNSGEGVYLANMDLYVN